MKSKINNIFYDQGQFIRFFIIHIFIFVNYAAYVFTRYGNLDIFQIYAGYVFIFGNAIWFIQHVLTEY